MDGLDIKQTINLVDYAQKNKSVRRTLIWMNEEKERKRERNRQTGRQAYRQIHVHVGQTQIVVHRHTHVQYR